MNETKLSILISAYNSDFIIDTIKSINKQVYFPGKYEIVIVIDGCKKTKEILTTYLKNKNDNKYKIYYSPINRGKYITSNTTINLSNAEDLLLIDSDDIAHPNLLKEIYSVSKDADVIQFGYKKFYDKYDIKDFKPNNYAAGVLWMRRNVITKLGGYKSWHCSADTEFLKRINNSDFNRIEINKALFYYRQHHNSLTNKIDMKIRSNYHNIMNNTDYTNINLYHEPEIHNQIEKL